VLQLTRTARKPRFALGAHVVDWSNEPGAVTAVYVDLDAAQDAGVVGKGWLAGLSKVPTTKSSDHWYSVLCESGGEILVGELDLRRAPKAGTRETEATRTTRAASGKPRARKTAATGTR
jgi:hypothetical protein